jgi:hypothetical protein
MPDGTLNLLINAGVAGVFAAFAVILTRDFTKFLAVCMTEWRKTLDRLAQEITALGKTIEHLDGKR